MPSVSLCPVDAADREYVTRLLEENDLPVDDLEAVIEHLRIGVADGQRSSIGGGQRSSIGGGQRSGTSAGQRIGVGGVVPYGDDGLLRSVVIAPDQRGEGYGAALVEALEDEARELSLDRVYLLTTTAAAFFDGLGYAEVPREDAPSSVQESREFAALCPASATCMRNSLE